MRRCLGCDSTRVQPSTARPYRVRLTSQWQSRRTDVESGGYPQLVEFRWGGYCEACAGELEKARQRDLRRQRRGDTVCHVCGVTFTPPRTDAAYCSNSCRQRAYRTRHTNGDAP